MASRDFQSKILFWVSVILTSLLLSACSGSSDNTSSDNVIPDTTNPAISITAPADGATVSGAVTFSATASDNIAVTRVEFSLDGGALLDTDISLPYEFSLDTTSLTNAGHTLTTTAFDAANNSQSASISVTVNNVIPDTTNPAISITAPADGATVSGAVTFSATASDNIAVTRVEFSLDGGALLDTDISSPYEFSLDTTSLTNAGHTLTTTAFDAANNSQSASISVTVNNVIPDTTNPTISITSPADGATVSGAVTFSATASDNIAVTRVEFSLDGGALLDTDISSPYEFSLDTTSLTNAGHTLTATAFDATDNSAFDYISVTVDNSVVGPPPNPADVAPPIDPTVATTMVAATEFLYSGVNPVQTGVAAGTINPVRVAVLRGKVMERDSTAISGVVITIHNHAEFGQTQSRADGLFDMAVNGGGHLTVNYRKIGYLPVQRQLDVPWQDYAWLPDVVMIPLDSKVTVLDLTSTVPMQVALGSPVTDSDGTRQAVLMIPQGTTASINLPGGGTQSISTLSFRATEYTVGDNGPEAMPGELPPTSGYTYAVELSTDEALASGIKVDGKDVIFNQPVPFYVDNFLNFPPGTIVPVGYYDNEKGAWIPYDNGLVIEIISETGGLADVDVDGDGVADTGTALIDLGITNAEREQLAVLYSSGNSLWRAQLTHLSTWDHNWPYVPPDDAVEPLPPPLEANNRKNKPDDPCEENGSIIECQNQTLGESVPVTGTDYTLNYRSDRVPGNAELRSVEVPLSGANLPASLLRIDLQVSVAGRIIKQSFPPISNQAYTFTWDGVDAYGRTLQGVRPVTVSVGYVYNAVYLSPGAFGQAFAQYAGTGTRLSLGGLSRFETTLWKKWQDTIGTWSGASQIGSWSINIHHAYDPAGNRLYLGDGSRRSAGNVNAITTVAGNGIRDTINSSTFNRNFYGEGGPATSARLNLPQDVVIGEDGSIFISDNPNIRRVGPDGIITSVAGNGISGFSGDGGPATQAQLRMTNGIAIGPDGSIYIADSGNNRIRRVTQNGIINTVVGNGTLGYGGDGGPATVAQMYGAEDVAVGLDGSLYVLDSTRIRRVDPDGIINTIAGNTTLGFSGDGGPAINALFYYPQSIDIGPDGSIYIADTGNMRIRRITPDGIINTVAGNGTAGLFGDGGLATDAQIGTRDIVIDEEGTIYTVGNYKIRRIGSDGIINTLAGTETMGYSGDNGPASAAQIYAPYGISQGPDGSIYIADIHNDRIRRVAPPLDGFTATDIAIPSVDGNELYHFDPTGRHFQTFNTLTGAVLYNFNYDADGFLINFVDGDSNTTTIERDFQGNPTAIIAYSGQRTNLLVNNEGYLESISNPAAETITFSYGNGGLLTSITKPNGDISQYTYDTSGLLTLAADAGGGSKAFSRSRDSTGYTVTMTTAMGRVTSYRIDYLPTGGQRSLLIYPNGSQTEILVGTDGSNTITNPDGMIATTQHGPDPRFGMLASVLESLVMTTPDGKTKTITQNRSVSLSNQDDPLTLLTLQNTLTVNGRTTTYNYDAATKSLTTTTPLGHQKVSQIDTLGRVISINLAAGIDTITTSYDPQGLIAQTSQGVQSWSYTYDGFDRITSRTDATGNVKNFSYDNADRVIQVGLPGGEAVGYSYDEKGNRTQVIMPSFAVHNLGYTPRDLLASYTPPAGTSFTRSYDLDKALINRTPASGKQLVNSFDATSGQWLNMNYPEATVAFAYNSSGDQLASLTRTPVSGSAQAVSYSYDGSLVTGQSWSGLATGNFLYGYDNNYLLTQATLNSGSDSVATAFTYDTDGMPTGYGPFTLIRGGPGGAFSQIDDSNLSMSIGYDTMARSNSRAQTVNGNSVYSYSLARNNVGRIVQKDETVNGVIHSYGYSYDADGRLLNVTRDTITVESYSYDVNGNRLSTLTEVASFDAQDRVMSHGSVAYQFDVDGYLTQRGSDTFQYSTRGELLSVTTGGNTISYDYDGLNRRVGRTDASGTVQYLYGDPGNPFRITALRDTAGDLSTLYYDENGLLFAMNRAGSMYYIATDQVGTPHAVADSGGAVIKVIDYDSFGKRLSDSNPAFDLHFGFAGGLEDKATGLVRFGLRDYDQASGRWAARDPVLYGGGQVNLYLYVGNNPVNLRDPLGLWCVGGSYYFGVGGGAQVCSKNGEWSVCAEGGIGIGGSVDIGSGDVADTGNKVKAEAGVDCGPIGLGVKCAYGSRCGLDCDLEGKVGPVGFDTNGDFKVSGDPGAAGSSSSVKPKCGYQAKLSYEGCGAW